MRWRPRGPKVVDDDGMDENVRACVAKVSRTSAAATVLKRDGGAATLLEALRQLLSLKAES